MIGCAELSIWLLSDFLFAGVVIVCIFENCEKQSRTLIEILLSCGHADVVELVDTHALGA